MPDLILNTSEAFARRDVLRLGGLMGLGLTLPQLLEQRAFAGKRSAYGKAKRVIMLFLHGGHPQQETFDPKPDGPEDVRGPFRAISTTVPGTKFCELLPKIASHAGSLAIVRSMTPEIQIMFRRVCRLRQVISTLRRYVPVVIFHQVIRTSHR